MYIFQVAYFSPSACEGIDQVSVQWERAHPWATLSESVFSFERVRGQMRSCKECEERGYMGSHIRLIHSQSWISKMPLYFEWTSITIISLWTHQSVDNLGLQRFWQTLVADKYQQTLLLARIFDCDHCLCTWYVTILFSFLLLSPQPSIDSNIFFTNIIIIFNHHHLHLQSVVLCVSVSHVAFSFHGFPCRIQFSQCDM